jgi:hypothetical protein
VHQDIYVLTIFNLYLFGILHILWLHMYVRTW